MGADNVACSWPRPRTRATNPTHHRHRDQRRTGAGQQEQTDLFLLRHRPGSGRGSAFWGMRAAPGAIERIKIDPETHEVDYKVIGRDAWRSFSKPEEMNCKGICGSGILDVLAELYRAGVIVKSGRFSPNQKSERFRQTPGRNARPSSSSPGPMRRPRRSTRTWSSPRRTSARFSWPRALFTRAAS